MNSFLCVCDERMVDTVDEEDEEDEELMLAGSICSDAMQEIKNRGEKR